MIKWTDSPKIADPRFSVIPGTALVRVVLRYAVAGVVVNRDGRIVCSAPILGWSVGRSIRELALWAASRGGMMTAIDE